MNGYPLTFKKMAVELSQKVGQAKAAEKLGVSTSSLYNWRNGWYVGASNRTVYSEEFKRNAIALSAKLGCTRASRQLGIPYSTLHQWVDRDIIDKTNNISDAMKSTNEDNFTQLDFNKIDVGEEERVRPVDEETEIKAPSKTYIEENNRLKQENQFLKGIIGYICNPDNSNSAVVH